MKKIKEISLELKPKSTYSITIKNNYYKFCKDEKKMYKVQNRSSLILEELKIYLSLLFFIYYFLSFNYFCL